MAVLSHVPVAEPITESRGVGGPVVISGAPAHLCGLGEQVVFGSPSQTTWAKAEAFLWGKG